MRERKRSKRNKQKHSERREEITSATKIKERRILCKNLSSERELGRPLVANDHSETFIEKHDNNERKSSYTKRNRSSEHKLPGEDSVRGRKEKKGIVRPLSTWKKGIKKCKFWFRKIKERMKSFIAVHGRTNEFRSNA